MRDYVQLWKYNCLDALVTREAHDVIQSELRQKDLSAQYRFTMNLCQPLLEMAVRGILVDREAIQAYSRKLTSEYDDKLKLLHEQAGTKINPQSPKQLITYFYTHKGEKPYISRTTGKATVDGTALKRLIGKGYPEAKTIMRLREIKKLTGSYLDIELDHDDRLRCSWNPVGTTTGRLSSSKTIRKTGLNLQTVPEDARAFLIPDPGFRMAEVDLSQAEARIVAYIAQDPNMISVFEKGEDIHALTARMVGCTRKIAKGVNHGSNYALGPAKLGMMLEIPQSEAKSLMTKYHIAYPSVRGTFHKYVEETLRRSRTLTNLFGRKRLFLGRIDDDLFRQGYSYIPQSTVGHITNMALMRLWKDKRVQVLAQVHDSVLFQAREDEDWNRLVEDVSHYFQIPLRWKGREFVIPSEMKTGSNWRDLT